MNKKITSLIGAAVLVMALPLQGLAAADADASLQPVDQGANVSLKLQQGAGEGVNALQMSFTLSPVVGSLYKANVSFAFDEDLAGTVKRYRFDQENNVLTVYVAGANGKLFQNDEADLGEIQVESTDGEYLEVSITSGLPSDAEHPAEEMATGLSLLRAGSSKQDLSIQAEAVQVKVGEQSPDPEPTPEVPEEPSVEPTAQPTTKPTQQPQNPEVPQDNERPTWESSSSTGSTGGSTGSTGGTTGTTGTTSGTVSATAKPGTTASSKAPASSSAAQSAVSEAVSESESQAASESSSSQAAESESQAESQSTSAQTEKSKVGVLPIVTGVVVAAAAVVAGVMIWRRGRD